MIPTTAHDPLDLVCGTSWEFSGPLHDFQGNPVPLAGAAIVWKLDSVDGETNYLTLSLGSGVTVLDTPSAEVLVNAAPRATAAVLPGIYRDWIIVTLADGTVLPMWTGIIRAAAGPK